MNKIQLFNNAEMGEFRVAVNTETNEPMFCLSDVCRALDLGNAPQVKTRLDCDGIITNDSVDSKGRKNVLTFINEPNLYKCIFLSRKPNAKAFQDWIFKEVIPSLRKNGGYIMNQENLSPEQIVANALVVAQNIINEQKQQLEQAQQKLIDAQPAIDYYARSTASVGSTTINMWAKNNGLKPLKVYEALRNHKYIGSVGRQHNIANSTVCKKGIFEVIRSILPNGRVNYTSYVMEDKAAHLLEVITKWEEYPFLINIK